MMMEDQVEDVGPNAEADPEMSAGIDPASAVAANATKNFRQQADIEAFYRFVHENDLREDALTILDQTRQAKEAVKTAKGRVKH